MKELDKILLEKFSNMAVEENNMTFIVFPDEISEHLAKRLGAKSISNPMWTTVGGSVGGYLDVDMELEGGGIIHEVVELDELQEIFKKDYSDKDDANIYYRWKIKAGSEVILSNWTTEDLSPNWTRCEPGKKFEEI
jgi:sporulation protein YlmC with PRC-barrel domain